METAYGKVAVHIAVDEARAPASALQDIEASGPVSAVIRKLTTVPNGIFAAAILTVTGVREAMVTSGLEEDPAACAGTATPFTEVMLSDGWDRVELAGGRYSGPVMMPGELPPL